MFLPPVLKPLSAGLAALYEFGVRARLRAYASGWRATRKLPAPVISVGNLTVGGTGKTPCTAYLATMLREAGYEVAILSRGYKRQSQGIVEVSDGQRILCSANEAGDEPYLLAQQCSGVRVVVNADRYAAGQWLLTRAKVDVFLLDDGFQHVQLHRDLNLALLDAREDLSKARMLPLGRWREPVSALRRADAVLITRASDASEAEQLRQQLKTYVRADVPVWTAQHELTGLRRLPTRELIAFADLGKQAVAALTAIAQPERFYADVREKGFSLVSAFSFPDHHRFTLPEVLSALVAAQQAGAAALLVTEKDAANLPAELWQEILPLPIYAAQLAFVCTDQAALREKIITPLRR